MMLKTRHYRTNVIKIPILIRIEAFEKDTLMISKVQVSTLRLTGKSSKQLRTKEKPVSLATVSKPFWHIQFRETRHLLSLTASRRPESPKEGDRAKPRGVET